MTVLSAVASRFPPSNNQLRMCSNPRNQETIQDTRVTVQKVQGRQSQSFDGTGNRGIATTLRVNYAADQPRVVKCYNCQREGHMARQCTHPKRPKNAAWFKEKLMLAEAQEASQILDEEQLTEDLDAYDSDCDDLSSPKAILMANLSSCDSDVLSEESQYVVIQDTNSSAPNDLLGLSLVEQMTDHVAHLDKENQTNKMVYESLTTELE
ncbi:zf-CCHC domain-containing protein [Tanacetum coccineum]